MDNKLCKLASAIVSRAGEIYFEPITDSHSDLIAHFGLKEGKTGQNFVRVEFTPEDEKIVHDPATYSLRVDEKSTPAWFDAEMSEKVSSYLNHQIARMIVTDDREILLGGVWIVSGKSKIVAAKACRIIGVSGSASIESVYGSASIESVSGSASIEYVSGSASIESVYGSASIESVYGSASIESVYGSASIKSVSGSASIVKIGDDVLLGKQAEHARKAKVTANT
jgi:hypothetical protein